MPQYNEGQISVYGVVLISEKLFHRLTLSAFDREHIGLLRGIFHYYFLPLRVLASYLFKATAPAQVKAPGGE